VEIDGEFTEESGYTAAKKILSLLPHPTAVFACSDYMAIGALSALHEAGVEVPNQMALAAFDNIPIANFTKPSLTTVNVAISNLGVRAVTCLINAVREKNSHEKQQLILPTTLVIRESCGCNIS
jgi:LacI family transcriptional regulator